MKALYYSMHLGDWFLPVPGDLSGSLETGMKKALFRTYKIYSLMVFRLKKILKLWFHLGTGK